MSNTIPCSIFLRDIHSKFYGTFAQFIFSSLWRGGFAYLYTHGSFLRSPLRWLHLKELKGQILTTRFYIIDNTSRLVVSKSRITMSCTFLFTMILMQPLYDHDPLSHYDGFDWLYCESSSPSQAKVAWKLGASSLSVSSKNFGALKNRYQNINCHL